MKRWSQRTVATMPLSLAALACIISTPGLASVASGRPVAAPTTLSAAVPDTGARYTPADVRFIQGMMAHHAQALVMTALVPARTTREDMRLLAQRIEVSQRDEIALMRHWLEDRHQMVPDSGAHQMDHAAAGHDMAMRDERMPGMLTPQQLARLTAATGAEFDRLFLQLMIQHHQGALVMVANLFATPGAGQETAVFTFASEVDADQRAEIRRMQAMLDRSSGASGRP